MARIGGEKMSTEKSITNDTNKRDKMSTDKIVYPELSHRIMEAAFEVHNVLGPGYLEDLYEEALVLELGLRGIPLERQKTIPVSYKGHSIGTHRLDLLADGTVILELKAASALTDVFKQQTLSYLKATGLRLGILMNFGTPRLEYTRIVN
jgi:GxxExxY protein